MPSPSFRFKQFEVWHDRCAQKVGTDGVLLGAWARTENCERILDIGTGSALIALMMAQRSPKAHVVGIEIDPSAAQQAQENVVRSPFSQRIEIVQSDVRDFHSHLAFDCIVCNPPFFIEETLPDNSRRAIARHTSQLQFSDLVKAVTQLLSSEGEFSVILPTNVVNEFVNQCFICGLYLIRKCLVSTIDGKPAKRSLLAFSRQGVDAYESTSIVLQNSDGSRTAAYQSLTCDFYL